MRKKLITHFKKNMAIGVITLGLPLTLSGCNNVLTVGADAALPDGQTAAIVNTTIPHTEAIAVNDEETQTPPVIRENGSLPQDLNEISKEEFAYHFDIIMKALKELDVHTISTYSGDANLINMLTMVRGNVTYISYWTSIFNDITYLPNSDIVVYRSTDYIFSNWYKNLANAESEIVDDVAEIPNDMTEILYKASYKEAPFIATRLFSDNVTKVDGGYLIVDISKAFSNVLCELDNLLIMDDEGNESFSYARLLMGDNSCLSLGYDYITKNISDCDSIVSLDLDAIIKAYDSTLSQDEKNTFYYSYYEQFYKNDSYRPMLADYLKNFCKSVRSFSDVILYRPANIDNEYPYYQANDEEKDFLRSIDLYTAHKIYSFPEGFNGNFTFFYQIIDNLQYEGLIPR